LGGFEDFPGKVKKDFLILCKARNGDFNGLLRNWGGQLDHGLLTDLISTPPRKMDTPYAQGKRICRARGGQARPASRADADKNVRGRQE
jgi:hypothetical protein